MNEQAINGSDHFDVILAAYKTWPDDICKKLSIHDLRRMTGWTPPVTPTMTFQIRVHPWMLECFGQEVADNIVERGDRLLEEVLELLQSHGYDKNRVPALVDYVFNRPEGIPFQEVGGVMVTLAAYCSAARIDMYEAGDIELARVWTKIDRIREKQASKRDIHSPLPGPGGTPA